jgi:hypothetical protein
MIDAVHQTGIDRFGNIGPAGGTERIDACDYCADIAVELQNGVVRIIVRIAIGYLNVRVEIGLVEVLIVDDANPEVRDFGRDITDYPQCRSLDRTDVIGAWTALMSSAMLLVLSIQNTRSSAEGTSLGSSSS